MRIWAAIGSLGMIAGLFSACQPGAGNKVDDREETLFSSLDPAQTGLDFINRVADSEAFNVFNYRNYYNGGGLALGDVNGDGLADIYLTANLQSNRLYLNLGDWRFEDVTEKAGVGGTKAWSTGVSMADVNGDGQLDIYVCNSGDVAGDNKENELFINQGDGTFREPAAQWNLNDPDFSTHASFFDYDGDGDCYILNNSFKDNRRIRLDRARRDVPDPDGGDKLMRNDGDHFTNVTQEAGMYSSSEGFGLGVSVSHLDGDHLPDIYVSNDFWERDYLYINQGDGTFREELTQRMGLTPSSSMGADIGDLNNDGMPEVFTTDMLPGDNYRIKTMMNFDPYLLDQLEFRETYYYQMKQNCLQVNQGQGRFQERAFLSGVATTDWSWGALMFDFDNDGRLDIQVSNGIFHDITDRDFTDFVLDDEQTAAVRLPNGNLDTRDLLGQLASNPLVNYAFVNQGNLRFENKSRTIGLEESSFSNSGAYGDLDNDGDLDLVINNLNMPSFLYRNEAVEKGENHFLSIRLEGPEANRFGLGASARLLSGGKSQVRQHYLSRGFQSSVAPGLHFGLGEQTHIDTLEVIWPDEKRQLLVDPPADQIITLRYAEASDGPVTLSGVEPLFEECSAQAFDREITHEENAFNDFDHERLLLRMLSTEGPRLVKGDINGDGLEDFVMLGARDMPDRVFLQDGEGQFHYDRQIALESGRAQESTCGVLFDPDGDGDLDLLVGSGGNEQQRGPGSFLTRLYENDGKGNLVQNVDLFPSLFGNLSTIKANDFDGDRDPDLFLGARSVPGNYGLVPRSFILRNDGIGRWNDLTTQAIGTAGMVTDAAWLDTDGDGDEDLVVVGDWMPVTIFENVDGAFPKARTLPGSSGWWNRLELADLNGDGRPDLLCGNWGLNSKFTASKEQPLTMHVKDFDGNGKSEFIISWTPPLDETAFPFADKKDITAQMPQLRKNSLTYKAYAGQTYESLFSPQQRAGALALKAENLATGIFWNRPDGFVWQALPDDAQVAPVFALVAEDFDADGHTDIWLGGNLFAVQPAVGHLSANHGVFLKGDGKGGFVSVPAKDSGFYITGEVRDAVWIENDSGKGRLIVARNNDNLLAFERKGQNIQ